MKAILLGPIVVACLAVAEEGHRNDFDDLQKAAPPADFDTVTKAAPTNIPTVRLPASNLTDGVYDLTTREGTPMGRWQLKNGKWSQID